MKPKTKQESDFKMNESPKFELLLLRKGTRRAHLGPIEIDVWQFGSTWRYTLFHTRDGVFEAHGEDYGSFAECADEAITAARNILHPVAQS